MTVVLFNHNPYAHIYDDHINLRFLYIFGGSGLLCAAAAASFNQQFSEEFGHVFTVPLFP